MASVTQLLAELRAGRRSAFDDLMRLVHADLCHRAAKLMRRERPDHTLQATALVNEAYWKLARQGKVDWRDRRHFLAVFQRAMKQVLIDHAKHINAQKGPGQHDKLPLNSTLLSKRVSNTEVDAEALVSALRRLAEIDPRAAEVVQLRFFGGLTALQTAAVLNVALATVERSWRFARAWLQRRLEKNERGLQT